MSFCIAPNLPLLTKSTSKRSARASALHCTSCHWGQQKLSDFIFAVSLAPPACEDTAQVLLPLAKRMHATPYTPCFACCLPRGKTVFCLHVLSLMHIL